MQWWRRDPRRLAIEREVVKNATSGRLGRLPDDSIVIDEDMVVAGIRFGLRIRYPETFPAECPVATLLYPELPVTAKAHRYTDGSLCLHAPGDWHPQRTALWLRNRAAAWMNALVVFSATGSWPEFRKQS